jgi:hypothetical protein
MMGEGVTLAVDILTLLDGANGAKAIPSSGSSPLDFIAEPQSLRLVTRLCLD